MSSSIEYHFEQIKCPECGTENEVEVITEYDTLDDDFSIDVAGYQECTNKFCKHRFVAMDLSD
jgi:hypothetical protein